MWDEIIKLAISNGLFAVLFVILLFLTIRDSHQREEKYQTTIQKLSEHLDLVEDINNDIKEIKKVVFGVVMESEDEELERKNKD